MTCYFTIVTWPPHSKKAAGRKGGLAARGPKKRRVPPHPLRTEAVRLGFEIGTCRAARQLGLNKSTVRSWCSKKRRDPSWNP